MNNFPPGQSWSKNVEAVGYCDFDGRPAFKMALHQVGDRWFMYVGHLWHRGWSVLDVTDPADPKHLRYIDGPDNTWTIQVQVADGLMITALEGIVPVWGGDPDQANEEGVLIWSLDDPENPVQIGHYKTGGGGTHRNFYDGGKYMHLSAIAPGYSRNIYQIIDIEDPAKPVEVGRWWMDGQWTDGGEAGQPRSVWLHGGPYVVGERAYLPYGEGGFVILDISDVAKPKQIGQLKFSPPFNPNVGVHTAVPILDRNLVVVNSEAIKEDCDEPLNFIALVDIGDETDPRLISLMPLPEPPGDAPFENFCAHGGRFGPHNQHQHQHQDVLLKNNNLLFMTYFNAGLRIYDIADATQPREVGFFLPPDPQERRGMLPTKLVTQSEDVIVDARGYIYISDKNHGIYILKSSDEIYANSS